MGTKTIGVRDEAYERLKARKREDESFTDLLNRLLDETTTDWREGFGTLEGADADELEQLIAESRTGKATDSRLDRKRRSKRWPPPTRTTINLLDAKSSRLRTV